jgi:hypothetical protein
MAPPQIDVYIRLFVPHYFTHHWEAWFPFSTKLVKVKKNFASILLDLFDANAILIPTLKTNRPQKETRNL